jgi:hypothetical protein
MNETDDKLQRHPFSNDPQQGDGNEFAVPSSGDGHSWTTCETGGVEMDCSGDPGNPGNDGDGDHSCDDGDGDGGTPVQKKARTELAPPVVRKRDGMYVLLLAINV